MKTQKAAIDDGPPTGPPKHNPFSAEHYEAINKVISRGDIISDAIMRAYHIGLDVGQHAAMHERDQAVARRMLAMYPPPPKHPLAE
jgi:hypothetical protein